MEDPALVEHLRTHRIPLTVCPSSNVRLRVFPTLAESNIGAIIKAGLTVRIIIIIVNPSCRHNNHFLIHTRYTRHTTTHTRRTPHTTWCR
jgi:hypothetical protein